MAFPRGARRAPELPRIRVPVFAVGRLLYVTGAGAHPAHAELTDEGGKKPLMSLGDGTEVAILGWRPGWGGATRYHVRATASGVEGWLPVGNLRSTEVAIPSAPAPPEPPTLPTRLGREDREDGGRRFGQRG